MKRVLIAAFILLIIGLHLGTSSGRSAEAQPLVYLLPLPNANNISPKTSLAIRAGSALPAAAVNLDLFQVTGSHSGRHAGRTVLSDDSLTLLFYPDQPFAYGESVTVTIGSGLKTADGTPVAGLTYHFHTLPTPSDPYLLAETLSKIGLRPSPNHLQTGGQGPYYTHPEFNTVMTTTVTTPAQNTDEGYIFVAPMAIGYNGPPAVMILDDDGLPVYIQTMQGGPFVGDFRKQSVDGTDYLTYHIGIFPGGYTQGASYVLDEKYQLVDTWTINNGYGSDVHEFLLLDNGHAILMAYLLIPFDLRPYGGPENGTLVEIILQEQDSNHNVVFEWHGSQNLPIGQTEVNLNTTNPVDFMHTNAIAVDADGHWLVSHRNYSEITKINRQTGAIIWRMGGQGNQFTFTNDIGFHNQHSINRLENGNITLFDNGTFHTPPHSRAIEYAVDEAAKTVTAVWKYPDDTSEYSAVMSNVQRLPNGSSFIGWGNQPKFSEVEADGTLALEIAMSTSSYRAFRFPWRGIPAEPPRAVVHYDTDPTSVTLYTSWNGATDIVSYDIYAGPTIAGLSLVENAPRTGFETGITLTGLAADTCFFRTKPIHEQGSTTPYSNITFRLDLAVCWEQLSHSYLPITRK